MITRDEWLSAVDAAKAPPVQDPNVLTVRELSALFGLGVDATRDRVRLLVKAGKAENATKTVRNVCGAAVRVPAYRLLKVEKPQRRKR